MHIAVGRIMWRKTSWVAIMLWGFGCAGERPSSETLDPSEFEVSPPWRVEVVDEGYGADMTLVDSRLRIGVSGFLGLGIYARGPELWDVSWTGVNVASFALSSDPRSGALVISAGRLTMVERPGGGWDRHPYNSDGSLSPTRNSLAHGEDGGWWVARWWETPGRVDEMGEERAYTAGDTILEVESSGGDYVEVARFEEFFMPSPAVVALPGGDLVTVFSAPEAPRMRLGRLRRGRWTERDLSAEFGFALGVETGLAVDDRGAVHLVALDLNRQRIIHAVEGDGAWAVETLVNVSAGSATEDMRIQIDSAGGAHVAYTDARDDGAAHFGTSRIVRYAARADGWTIETLGRGAVLSMLIDGEDAVHVAFARTVDDAVGPVVVMYGSRPR